MTGFSYLPNRADHEKAIRHEQLDAGRWQRVEAGAVLELPSWVTGALKHGTHIEEVKADG